MTVTQNTLPCCGGMSQGRCVCVCVCMGGREVRKRDLKGCASQKWRLLASFPDGPNPPLQFHPTRSLILQRRVQGGARGAHATPSPGQLSMDHAPCASGRLPKRRAEDQPSILAGSYS